MLETSFELETSGLRAEVKRKALREGLKEGREKGRKEGIKEGRKEGRAEGMKEGMKEGKLETANQLMSAGVPLELIVKATNLTEQQILNYRKKFSVN